MDLEHALSNSNLNTTKEMVLDEDKIVTYISLSKDLCIHVNYSKILLDQVVQNIRKTRPNIEIKVNYIISGLSNVNKARITVCPESDLEEMRKTFTIVYFEHIYSISKTNISNDNVTFLLINNYRDFSLCPGFIKNSICNKLSSSEIKNYKSNSLIKSEASLNKPQQVNKSDKKVIKEDNGQANKQNNLNLDEKKFVKSDCKTITEVKVKSEVPSPEKELNNKSKQNGQKLNGRSHKDITGFFNKKSVCNKYQQDAKENNVKIEKMETDEEEVTKETSNKTKGIKLSDNQNSKKPKKEVEISIVGQEKESQEDTYANGENKKLNEIIKSSKVDKKRKRVLHVVDSESENEVEKEERTQDSDDEIPPTPMANNIKITSGLVNPKKKRKVIDKMYTDDEGYILTKKVEVYESCSEDEIVDNIVVETKVEKKTEVKKEVSPKSKTEIKTSKKKISPPQKGKQAVLTNFFKRK